MIMYNNYSTPALFPPISKYYLLIEYYSKLIGYLPLEGLLIPSAVDTAFILYPSHLLLKAPLPLINFPFWKDVLENFIN